MTTDAFVIGGGPAGLMAAQQLLAAGHSVTLFDSQRSVGRKFLLAGIGGLNLTHSENRPGFDHRFAEQADWVSTWLDQLDGPALRAWADRYNARTFVGTSGRVFPQEKKAAPLLRAWLSDLRSMGLEIRTQHRLVQFGPDELVFSSPHGEVHLPKPRATVLALGGGSWPQLGSDGAWVQWFDEQSVAPLQPSNCGMEIQWSPHLLRIAGAPLKPVILHWTAIDGSSMQRQGECVLTQYGLEGSALYPAIPALREQLRRNGKAIIHLDLAPHTSHAKLASIIRQRGTLSNTDLAKKRLNLSGARLALFNEYHRTATQLDTKELAARIKWTPLVFTGIRPVAESISSAGGVRRQALNDGLMLKQSAGVFCAGEMLDWEAPTGGYLLTACFASGKVAGQAAAQYLQAADQ